MSRIARRTHRAQNAGDIHQALSTISLDNPKHKTKRIKRKDK